MGHVPRWVERRFAFEIPVDQFPNVCGRLAGTAARLEDATRGLTRERLTQRVDRTWSIQQNVGHLLDLEPLAEARLAEFLAGAERLSAADMTNAATEAADHDARPIDELLACFRGVRTALVERLWNLAPAEFARVAVHPRLEVPMRLVDFLVFCAEHDDHHIARILELRRSASK